MKCPNCNVNLVMSNRNDIEIDYCPECRGVWLDRGELDKIIERSTPNAPETRFNNDRNQQSFSRDDSRYPRKKKGLLGDLFDF